MNISRKILASAFVSILVTGGVLYWNQSRNEIIQEVDPGFSSEQRAKIEQQLSDRQKQLQELKEDASSEEKARSHYSVARTLYVLGEYAEARELFAKAVEIMENYPLYLDYYNLLTSMRDFDTARDIARQGLDIFPINIDLWRSLIALEESQLGADETKILSLYLEALTRSEFHPDLTADFARLQERRGNISEALKYWKIAAERAPMVQFYSDQVKRLEKISP